MNYDRLVEAKKYYESLGFIYKDVPWTTDYDVHYETAPPDTNFYQVNNKLLVASGEQSFIQLLKNKTLPAGKYQTITPCFRNDNEDELHQRYFMKLELLNTNVTKLEETIQQASDFFNKFLPTKLESTKQGIDIISKKTGIELGSYGIRHSKFGAFVYGTGLAEPRLTIVLEKE